MKKLILILLLLTYSTFADISIYGHISNETCAFCPAPSYLDIRRCDIIFATANGETMAVVKVNNFLNYQTQFTPNSFIELYHINTVCQDDMYLIFSPLDVQLIDNTTNQINGLAYYR